MQEQRKNGGIDDTEGIELSSTGFVLEKKMVDRLEALAECLGDPEVIVALAESISPEILERVVSRLEMECCPVCENDANYIGGE